MQPSSNPRAAVARPRTGSAPGEGRLTARGLIKGNTEHRAVPVPPNTARPAYRGPGRRHSTTKSLPPLRGATFDERTCRMNSTSKTRARRLLAVAGFLAVLVAAAAPASAAPQQKATQTSATAAAVATDQSHTPGTKPTLVLVHGAWADGSSWSKVTRRGCRTMGSLSAFHPTRCAVSPATRQRSGTSCRRRTQPDHRNLGRRRILVPRVRASGQARAVPATPRLLGVTQSRR
jgi:hypothetical protein